MFLRMFKFFLPIFAFVLVVSGTAFAEGDSECRGKVMGESNLGNPNAGSIDFDSHPLTEGAGSPTLTDLSIVLGLGVEGLAPGNRSYAACVSEDDDIGTDEYVVRGYAWNDNLGFISFYCDGETGDGKNEGIDCGSWDYGVEIWEEGGGVRQLSGYAWNEAFGYIDFDPVGYPGVTMDDVTGALSGHAWSGAEIWIDFSGVTIQLPGEEIEIVGDEWCDGKPWLCIEVKPDPDETGSISMEELGDIKLANGDDYYEIHLYLREEDGVTPLDLTEYELNEVKFNWEDTVKINQLSGTTAREEAKNCGVGSLGDLETPWGSGCGAVVYKPLSVNLKDFDEVAEDPGHYILRQGIRSYAPTTNANVSYTTSTQPAFPFYNESFFTDLVDEGGEVWSHDVESNVLKLGSVEFELIKVSTGQPAVMPQVIYPNGKDGLSFKFLPVIEVDPLYANDLQDTILAFRGIPMNFRVGLEANGSYSFFSKLFVELFLDYARDETVAECVIEGKNVVDFDFQFVDSGESTLDISYALGSEVDVQGIATLPGYIEDEEGEPEPGQLPCSVAQGPTLYSRVSYYVEADGHEGRISYYSNKLPRITSLIVNPVAVIHGNVYAPEAFSPTGEGQTQATGNVAIDVVRNTVNENVRKYLADVGVKGGGECEIQGLVADNLKVSCSDFGKVEINGENILYFKNSEVHLNLAPGKWEGKWVVILDGGQLFIDSDIYRIDGDGGLAIVQMRPFEADCAESNIYIDSVVKNIQANIVTDCSVFSYDSGVGIDKETGFPAWGEFSVMVNSLSNQLLIEGSIASRNTIGGADLDVADVPKDYLLLGTGEVLELPVTADERQRAQVYDLNYLRLFKLDIEKSEGGLPIDQSCGKALTVDDMIAINDGQTVIGETGAACDGIDPTNRWDPPDWTGDLVPIGAVDKLAEGLDPDEDFDPLYIFYKAPDSFVFEKTGAYRSQ